MRLFITKCLIFVAILGGLEARYLNDFAPFDLQYYRIIDLGPTYLPKRLLLPHCWPVSLAPRINNRSEVIGNRGDQSFIWTKNHGFHPFFWKGLSAELVAINNKGVVLGKIDNGRYAEWFLWTDHCSCYEQDNPSIPLACLDPREVFLRAINDQGYIIGARRDIFGRYISIFWDHQHTIKDLPCETFWDINNQNNILGSESIYLKEQPILWHLKGGMAVIPDDSSIGKPKGIRYFFNPVIAGDNTVYGNFIGDKFGNSYIYSFLWNCIDHLFIPLDLGGMKISAINSCHVLVGSNGGEAVISFNHHLPIKLSSLIPRGRFGWDLINATDINDKNQIVGYGYYFGSLHLFLLDPVKYLN